jgi:hypothetical protein
MDRMLDVADWRELIVFSQVRVPVKAYHGLFEKCHTHAYPKPQQAKS